MKDPADTTQIIDMRHFLVVGSHGGGTGGLVVEIGQALKLWASLTEWGHILGIRPNFSGFDAQDFLSNALGADFYYFRLFVWGEDFASQLEAWCRERERMGKCK